VICKYLSKGKIKRFIRISSSNLLKLFDDLQLDVDKSAAMNVVQNIAEREERTLLLALPFEFLPR